MPIGKPARITQGNVICGGIGILLMGSCIATAVLFPKILDYFIKQQVLIGTDSNGEFTWAGGEWAKPTFHEHMSFYGFTLENEFDVMYWGKKPVVREKGPYVFYQTDNKHNVAFGGDSNWTIYQNYRTWYWNQSLSCDLCTYNDTITGLLNQLDKLSNTTTSMTYKKYGEVKTIKKKPVNLKAIFNIASLLIGMRPTVTVPFGDLLFTGYHDPIIDSVNLLEWFLTAKQKQKLPAAFVGLKEFAFFYGYNASDDGIYRMKTGQGEVDEIGKLMDWKGESKLPDSWWAQNSKAGDIARTIRGSDGGQIQKPFLEHDAHPEIFVSYWCRSFHLDPVGPTKIKQLETQRYKIPDQVFNMDLKENEGYKIVDAPEGLMTIPCQPGKRIEVGIPVAYSAPHFRYSPKAQQESIIGMHPDMSGTSHNLGWWDYIALIGYPMHLTFRQQINVPNNQNDDYLFMKFIGSENDVNRTYLPLMWLREDVTIDDTTAEFVLTFVQNMPKAAEGFVYIGLIIGVIILIVAFVTPSIQNRYRGFSRAHFEKPRERLGSLGVRPRVGTGLAAEEDSTSKSSLSETDDAQTERLVESGGSTNRLTPVSIMKAAPSHTGDTSQAIEMYERSPIVQPSAPNKSSLDSTSINRSINQPVQQAPPPPDNSDLLPHQQRVYPTVESDSPNTSQSYFMRQPSTRSSTRDRFQSVRSADSYQSAIDGEVPIGSSNMAYVADGEDSVDDRQTGGYTLNGEDSSRNVKGLKYTSTIM